MTEWLQGCEACNSGICKRIDELTAPDDNGKKLSRKKAALMMEAEQQEQFGLILYPAATLLKRYQRNQGAKVRTRVPNSEQPAAAVTESENAETGISIKFERQFQKFQKELQAAKDSDWTTTTHEQAARCVNQLMEIINPTNETDGSADEAGSGTEEAV